MAKIIFSDIFTVQLTAQEIRIIVDALIQRSRQDHRIENDTKKYVDLINTLEKVV